jgi:DNA-binding NarL/FixJ family response regulator
LWLRRVEGRQEHAKDDPEADQYAEEFYGSRLIRWRNRTLSSHQRNQLVKAVWPHSWNGRKLVLLTPKHDAEGARPTLVYKATRAFLERHIGRFITRLELEHGRLGNAVKAGACRGLKRYILCRVVDRFRQLWGRDRRKAYPLVVADPDALWRKVDQVGLSRRDHEILRRYLAGASLAQIGLLVGYSESNVRKRVRLMEPLLGLPPRPRWQRRAGLGRKSGYRRPDIGSPMISANAGPYSI